ncbi:transcriptional regulator Spx [Lactovum miscens]|uniref:Regulatory protein spx n=1 Tax=Lactovum miscens TaxID=190387 RepID=A0A841C7B2_9LACT|nr:transcriptional regulator Spx [Lactovum miscens]MBB5888234.1 regulatory protein spx [Lactovum miscens]
MIIVYSMPSCSSCKKAEEWLRAHELKFKEVNLLTDGITKEDILKILSLTDEGAEDIISKRSKAYSQLEVNFNNVSMNDLINIIEDNRTILRRPLILDNYKLQIGFNEDEIRKFIPRSYRKAKLDQDINQISKSLNFEEPTN